MRRVHLTVGVITLVAFAVTGMIMRTHNPRLRDLGDDIRLMYRSRHIYLLGSGIANLLLGLYLVPRQAAWRRRLQHAGSVFFLAAPVSLAFAFFTETEHGLAFSVWRSTLGLFALLGGTILHFVAAERAP